MEDRSPPPRPPLAMSSLARAAQEGAAAAKTSYQKQNMPTKDHNKQQAPKAVDLVTGKAITEYYFDPSLVLQEKNEGKTLSAKDKDTLFFQSKHLFMPCTIIKPIHDDENHPRQQHQHSNNKKKKKKNKSPKNPQHQGKPFPGPTLVKTTADGVLHKISDSTKLIPLQMPQDKEGLDDVLGLPKVSEASLLHTLRLRYKRDDIYTSAGQILISINPYKEVLQSGGESIYSEKKMMQYRNNKSFRTEKPPHLFQIADRAYTALMDSVHSSAVVDHLEDEDAVMMLEHHTSPGQVRNQSIIISGESGAGKTEATKIIMKYLARITRKNTASTEQHDALEDRVLSSNPLLETFGNAQTLRNNNSSRFGKFIHINFSCTTGAITGASISNYLLEKTRITNQVDGERNYHIFYQMLFGADEEMLERLGLEEGLAGFRYLGNRQGEKSDVDAKGFDETVQCLTSIGLSKEDQHAVFEMAAAVLHLGNIQFEEKSDEDCDTAKVTEASLPSLKKACELLGLDEDRLSEAVLTKVIVVNGKSITKPQNVSMAEDKRDALAKMTYSCLFVWLVNCVNDELKETTSISASKSLVTDKKGFIGVLDIYGFECFERNGFEQLLINYCNEKLQRHFNRHLFEVEQELYANEGVDWSYITFNDNRPCLELIEGSKGTAGILQTLDDAWGGMGAASEKDGKFVKQLHNAFGTEAGAKNSESGHPNFVTPKFGKDRDFIVCHYAGKVKYTVEGFVEKNMETLSNELRELGEKSSKVISKKVYSSGSSECLSPTSSTRSSIRGISVGSQFRTSLQSLVSDLERTQPHYIRCVKPNPNKAPGQFVAGDVLKQLQYSGMMEAIRIRQEGYALREEHESFFDRFSVLLSPDDLKGDETRIVQLVKALSKRLCVGNSEWQVGHGKIFLRRELSDKLERLAKLRVHCAARTLTRFGKKVVNKRLAKFFVTWARFRLRMLERKRERKAAAAIAALVRGRRQMLLYAATRQAVIRIQTEQRRRIAVKRVRRIRDPFCDMTFRELKKLLVAEQASLDSAVGASDFRRAAKLETKIASIHEAIERKRPLTRAVIDEKIQLTKKELDDAVRRKAFSECGPLQDKLEELAKKQAELPTIDELRKAVNEAEEAVALAAKNRDFAGAAAAQAGVDEARARLADVMAANDDDREANELLSDKENSLSGCESRAQLESELAEITQQIKVALDSKNFGKASTLQKTLEAKERMRQLFPTIQELQAELDSAKEKVEEAIANKDFAKAGSLNDSVTELEKRIEAEKARGSEVNGVGALLIASITKANGEVVKFDSRTQLEKEISVSTEIVAKCVAERNFKKADKLQAEVDSMIKLRELLPSVNELKEQLNVKKKEMDAAISRKEFALADELHSLIERIEQKLKKEQAARPLSSSVTNKVDRFVPKAQAKVLLATPSTEMSKAKAVDSASVKALPVKSTSNASVPRSSGSNITLPTAPLAAKRVVNAQTTSSRPVAKLRPAKPILGDASDTILDVAKRLVRKRGNACVVVDGKGSLTGILTDTDVTRRVVAKYVDATSAVVSEVMTPNPTCVAMSDSAMDALATMLENRFRHLPVVDGEAVVGVLDIAKVLNDAISKLEKRKEKSSSSTAEDAVKQAINAQGASGGQTAALQTLLSNLMAQAFGNQSMPTLRSLLADKPSTVVSPQTSIREAGLLMAEMRKAALVVDAGELVGIFGFKDMMTRAVAENLPLESTPISEVMTPNPEVVSPDVSVLDALHTMHDNRFLTLPVCEEDGTVVGLVDVMDVIHGCGGTEGWRSIFTSSMEIEDDASDANSVHSLSVPKSATAVKTRPERTQLSSFDEAADLRPVSTLRPSKPIVASYSDSILQVAKVLANKRGSAALITSPNGSLEGIFTDTDVTCRVVAKYIDAEATGISDVMTPGPKCVTMSDSAMDALTTMVENHFRHLPVVDDKGVVGLLDIAKCLNSVISKLERMQSKTNSSAQKAVNQVISQQGAKGSQAKALQVLLGNLMSQAFGSQATPTLRSLLADKPSTVVSPDTSIRDASLLMAESRKAALVIDDSDNLVGLFGFKDMMARVVAKELPVDTTEISEVMTPNPLTVSPDSTVLEALQTMHDERFLTLPVCEDDGRVVGLVDVMDVIYGCGGAQGWRAIFSSMMQMTDDISDTASALSQEISRHTSNSERRLRSKKDKSVAKLRPSKPHISCTDDSILSVAKMLQKKRGSASLIVDTEGSLAGILTETDVTRRVVAEYVDARTTVVSEVMTPNPTCVAMTGSATDALTKMIENHFRHLPVVDGEAVVGVLDIAKCLNDAISKLEKCQEKTSSSAEDALKQAINAQGASGGQAAALQALLSNLMAQAFGNQSMPTLRSLLADKPSTVVSPQTSVRETGLLMAENRKAALIVEDGELVGIFSFKDMMSRAVAEELPLETTPISEVMTQDPEAVSPEITVLEALQTMHDHRFLTLPVCEEDGTVLGLVDVMDVIYGCGGADGWRSIFNRAMDLDDFSAASTGVASNTKMAAPGKTKTQNKAPHSTPFASKLPGNIPSTLEFLDEDGHNSFTGSTIGDERGVSKLMVTEEMSGSVEGGSSSVVFKVSGPSGTTHRVRCEPKIDDLLAAISEKIDLPPNCIKLEYQDDEGDVVIMTSNDDVAEAWNLARKTGKKMAKLTASKCKAKSKGLASTTALVGGGITAVALLGVVALTMLKPRK